MPILRVTRSRRQPCGSLLLRSRHIRALHAPWRPSSSPTYADDRPETAILSASLRHVPDHGFTHQALACGARDAGFLPASTSLFKRGPFDLVLFYLVQQRLALAQHAPSADALGSHARVADDVRRLLLVRLRRNEPVAARYSEAIALMSLAGNIPASLAELWRLSDDVWYLAGDKDVDSKWYAKRTALAGVYAASELFMSQDASKGFVETERFLDRRLQDMHDVGHSASSVGQWVGFTASASVNVLRSWGVRI